MSDNVLMDTLLSRRSLKPKYLTTPTPTLEVLAHAARAALRAPDHDSLTPYRFVAIREEDREKLADLFEAAARQKTTDEEKLAKARSKAKKGPQLVAFIFSPKKEQDDVSETEQLITAGAALEQFLLALKAQGFAAIVLSGSALNAPEVQAAFIQSRVNGFLRGLPAAPLRKTPRRRKKRRGTGRCRSGICDKPLWQSFGRN